MKLRQRESMHALATRLGALPGVCAVVLGGSHARGEARPDSDVDLGIYYREADPFSLRDLRAIAEEASSAAPAVVTELWEWGPWVNGGAWLVTDSGKVDLLYRCLEHVERTIEEAHAGKRDWNYAQTPVYGFHSVTYLAEVDCCVPLHDPEHVIEPLKRWVAEYPPRLREVIVQDFLWHAEFTLRLARPLAARGDVYLVAGSLTRLLSSLTQALFALNRSYFANDKGALERIGSFAVAPGDYAARVQAILAAAGSGPEALATSLARAEQLLREVADLAGPLYRPAFVEPGAS